MLDLNFVRENLETVRASLEARGFPTEALDTFAEADAERRRIMRSAR
jgi:seryl-tRNA synthetase